MTTVLGTNTVTFYGSAAKYTPTVVHPITTTAAAVAANTSTHVPATPAYGAIKVLVTDSAGAPVTGATVYAVSDDLTVINANYQASRTTSTATG